jgi:hypothetical protein
MSCENNSTKGKRMLATSSGKINNLSVVVDNDLWESAIGESIRNILGEEVYGLPQAEPLFTLRQMPTVVFTDFAKRNRTVLKIEKGSDKTSDTKYYENPFAIPQKLVLITGATNTEIIEQLKSNSAKIIAAFKAEEIKERQKQISKSLHTTSNLQSKLGVSLRFPSAYRVAKEDENFFWLRRDIRTGSLDLLVYELPMDAIVSGDDVIDDIIKMRDSIGKKYIPGPVEGTYMTTEDAYTPFIRSMILDNKPTIETKSLWEVNNAFMSGPFINYVITDEINDRIIVIEGFAYAPSVSKRDYVFELEAIIKSIKIS